MKSSTKLKRYVRMESEKENMECQKWVPIYLMYSNYLCAGFRQMKGDLHGWCFDIHPQI